MPLLHALSPVPILSTNVALLAIAAPFVWFMTAPSELRFRQGDSLAFAILLYGCAAWIWYPVGIQQSRVQGTLQWTFSITCLWMLVRRWIVASGVNFFEISRACFIAASLLAICILLEFILANTSGRFFSDYIPFSIDKFPQANVFGSNLLRPRVFSAEAGFTAVSLELFLPFSVIYYRHCSPFIKFIYFIACLTGVLLLFSVAGIISAILAIALLNLLRGASRFASVLTLLTLFGVIVFSTGLVDIEYLPFYKVWEFFDASNYELLQGSRQEAIAASWKLISENWLGIGWGTVLQEAKIPGSEIDRMILGNGLISLWMELTVATGTPGAVLFFIYIFSLVTKLARIRRPESDVCFIAVVALLLHHVAIYEVWFPMLWFALAVAQILVATSNMTANGRLKQGAAGSSTLSLRQTAT